ncbi:12607_t:CDS:2 [Gigaspora margarita]|uniref:12607_t:CDS:1 n=1 Tax=Gigaspora margarita TaxID=4874 RepID=A0ABN7UFC1_GIGMA|nr:12607_t:CDS:2 [Gigaspora margarita]
MMGVKRVVSLLPSAAEIISLIVGNNPSVQLVGRSHEDDYPPSVTTLPILTAPKTKFTTTADVDVQVSNLLAEGNSLYTLDIALLKSLRPDIVITQDVISSISDVGKALEMIEESSRAISMLRSRINHARDLVNQSIASGRKRSKVAFFEWTSPIYLGGHWTPQLIRWSNGIQVLADCKDGDTAEMGAPPSVRVPPEDIIREKPEILIVCPCGLNLDATRKEYEETLLPSNWWPPLAKYASKIALVDGNQMFNRSGPRESYFA